MPLTQSASLLAQGLRIVRSGTIGIGLALLLCGCQTTSQTKAVAISTALRQINDNARACYAQNFTKIADRPFSAHLHINPAVAAPTLAQLSDKDVPTADDIRTLVAWHAGLQECRQARMAGFSRTFPAAVPIFVATYTAYDAILADLIDRRLSWGQANRKLAELSVENSRKIETIRQQLEESTRREHKAELADRQAAAAALAQWNFQQQLLNQNQNYLNLINRPTNTTCSRFGSMVNCTTN